MSTASGLLLARRYQLDARIAAGGFGEVWRAVDVILGRPVAIKLLQAGYLQHEETLARFRAEARHTAALSHENIAHVYDYGEPAPPHPPFLVMELIDGPSLAGVLARGPVNPVRVMDIVAQAASGLHAAHLAGLVHRDVKPGNVLLSGGDLVKITDFGVAHAAGSSPVTSTGMVIGTPSYLAPERVRGSSATAASDLYSLGVVAYECLAGAPPFAGTGVEVALAHRDSPLPPLPASVPAEAAALVFDLTAKDPAARPASAVEVARRAGRLRDRMAGTGIARAGGSPGSLPGTVSDHLPAAAVAATQRRRRDGGLSGARFAIAAAAVVAAVMGLVAGLTGAAPPQHPVASPSSTPPPGPLTAALVSVGGSSLIGRPVSAAVRRLHQLGLGVRVFWRPSDLQRPGMVLSVSPDRRVAAGGLVTVTGALQTPSTRATPLGARRPQDHGEAAGRGTPRGHGKPHRHSPLHRHGDSQGRYRHGHGHAG